MGPRREKIHTGQNVDLDDAPNFIPEDILHDSHNCLMAMDHGKMDRFDLIPGAFQENQLINYTRYRQDQIPNYWALANRFVLADEFFTSVHGPASPIISSPSPLNQAERSIIQPATYGLRRLTWNDGPNCRT